MKITLYAPYHCFPEGTPAELPAEFRLWAGEQLRMAGYDADVTDKPNPHRENPYGPTAIAWRTWRDPSEAPPIQAKVAIDFCERLWAIFNRQRNG